MSGRKKQNPREAILASVRRGLGRQDDAEKQQAVMAAALARVQTPKQNLLPKRAQLAPLKRLDLFLDMAVGTDATVQCLQTEAEVPEAVIAFLRAQNLPMTAAIAPDPSLDAVPWWQQPLLTLRQGRTEGDDAVAITGVFRAVAETGTCMVTSSPETPTGLNFLPETHLIVLWASQIVGTMEEGWAALRTIQTVALGAWRMPRMVNFITGPSRSADIEQTLQLGAHGPRRLHLIVINDLGVDPMGAAPGTGD